MKAIRTQLKKQNWLPPASIQIAKGIRIHNITIENDNVNMVSLGNGSIYHNSAKFKKIKCNSFQNIFIQLRLYEFLERILLRHIC